MRFSLTRSQYDNQPITAEMSWAELVKGLSEPQVTKCHPCPSLTLGPDGKKGPDKCEARKVGMFGAQVFDGEGKKLANVVEVSFLMFDIDHKPRAHIAAVCEAVKREGLQSCIYSTHSHDPAHDDYCMRLMLPLTAPIVMAQVGQERYRAFYKGIADLLGMDFDQQTKDQTRLVFQPTRPEGGPPFLFATTEGKSVDYFEPTLIHGNVSSSAPVVAAISEPPATGPVSDIGELFNKILRSGKIEPEIKEAFRRSRDGKPFAQEGARDTTLYKAASKAVFCCYDADLYTLLELFRGGCNAMAPRNDPDGKTWLQKVEFDLERAIWRRENERAETKAKEQMAIEAGFRTSASYMPEHATTAPRIGLYMPDELAEFYASQHCKDEREFRERWVIRYKGGNWIFENGVYGPAISDEDMSTAVGRNLARSGIPLTTDGKDGMPRDIPWQTATKPFTSQAQGGVQGSLLIQTSYYDPADRVFHEATCPARKLEPTYDADVAEWFSRFKSEKFLDWIAAFSNLKRTTALLYLDGPKGIGKTLLPTALSRLWTTKGPALFANVIGTSFNDQLTQCPLIFADEEIPKTPGIMAKIRAMLAAKTFALNRKFMPTTTVEGKLRVIVSGNDDDLLNTEAQLNSKSVEAVSDRILYLNLDTTPGEWIRHLVKTKGSAHIDAWVEQDVVIKHVLWMAQHRAVSEEGGDERAVGGGSKEFTEQLTTVTGGVPAVLEFLARYLSEPSSLRQATKLARIGQGRVLVSTELMADKLLWEKHAGAHRLMPAAKISKALQQIREKDEEVDGRWYHVVRVSTVLEWMRKNQVGNYRDAKARIAAP